MVAVSFLSLATLLLPLTLAGHIPPHKRSSHERARKNFEKVHEARDEAASNSTLVPRGQTFSGTGTFYYTGLGACGQYSKDSDFMVALNSAQYGGGYPGPQCFKGITIQANGKTVGGVTIMDECPTCGYGSLDLSPGLFSQFAGYDAGVVSITWWFNDDAPSQPEPTSTTPTSTWTPPTSTWVPLTTTSEWHEPSTTTSEWVAPTTSSATPSTSTTQWSQPAASSSTSSSSTITSSAGASSSAASSSSSLASSTIAHNTTNPFVVVSSNGTATALPTGVDGETSAESSATTPEVKSFVANNLEAFNALAAQYGQLVVVAAEAAV
ncbi:hypothetical protein IAU60_000689 [Kwoniella sp. DSM 27419]